MARLNDLPNELYLELLCQCHPRDVHALARASPPIFRVFQWHRLNIINRLIRRLFVAPRPAAILSVAHLRLLGTRCKSTKEYEQRVRFNFDQFTDLGGELAKKWPSDLPTLAILADLCVELDLLTEKIRNEHWLAMLERATAARRNLGSKTVPLPTHLGAEEAWLVQSGLLLYELYCRLFYHGSHTLHLDTPRFRERFRWRKDNFLPAIQFVYDIHWTSLLQVLNDESPRGTFPSYIEPPPPGHTLHQVQNNSQISDLHWIPPDEKAKFLRYLSSFGTQFATKVSQCPPSETKTLILSKFSDFRKLDAAHPRHYFPQPECEPVLDYLGKVSEERWNQRVTEHRVYSKRYKWYIGPWFQDWSVGLISQEEWWDNVCHWEQFRSLADEHESWMQHRYGG
ncbi:hypothetical protein PG993_005730 [Apiospora rasikravindrae]|uniref:F-box domain-containing protein n=1 Tax=Apiospora rasikravindrae TaxID=990691 RepID=A0ABR1T9M7_9PEZI